MKEYIQLFVWIMLFVVVVEMIFPDSEYRKYLKLILGCMIMYTLIKPVVQFIPVEGKSYDEYVTLYQNKLLEQSGSKEIQQNYEDEAQKQQDLIKRTFSENIKQLIEKEMDISVKSVEVEWASEAQTAQIEKIYLIIGEKNNREDTIFIPSIQIGDKSNSLSGDEEKLKIKIKTCLKNFYNVTSRNIYITVQKN